MLPAHRGRAIRPALLLKQLQTACVQEAPGGCVTPRRRVESKATNGPAPLPRPGPGTREVSPECTPTLTLAHPARLVPDAMRAQAYRATPLGEEVGRFMRYARSMDWQPRSLQGYESTVHRVAL